MDISDQTFKDANRRAGARQTAFPAVISVRYDRRVSRVVIALASGIELAFSPSQVEGLEHARPADLRGAEISPSGFGIYFPLLAA